ncbi:hypothetical protein [Rhodopila globiformis]|uniref:hypothetical protein n=1 Tax=Rhodopila globiformis TaxID=1071 RepID=UPI001304B763|nr:hypothetical protein [Rhodopila globiformis]
MKRHGGWALLASRDRTNHIIGLAIKARSAASPERLEAVYALDLAYGLRRIIG